MAPEARISIGVVSPSSVTPRVELRLSSRKLKEAGFSVRVHPQVGKRHLFFAGPDDERARGIADYAFDPAVNVLWCGRGGSGAIRVLPLLEKLTAERGIPAPKLLVGYSDATALMEFVRTRWGWSTLHGPMLGLREFSLLRESHWKTTVKLVRGERTELPYSGTRLKFIGEPPRKEIRGEVVGGNLTVWASLIGTPFAGMARGRILFFEDVGEPLYRIDRVVQQIALSGGFDQIQAVVLGTFEQCEDAAPRVLVREPEPRRLERTLRKPKPDELKSLRPLLERGRALREIFSPIGEKYGVPVATGLPVGHGPEYPPLPLGAEYSLSREGRIKLLDWSWFED